MRTVLTFVTLFASLVLFAGSATASRITDITWLEGSGSLIRGTSRYSLVKGITLKKGDIIELKERAQVQIEFGDGTAVAFGGQSRAMLTSASGKGQFYVLSGIVKASSPKNGTPVKIDSPQMDNTVLDATTVILVSPSETEVFAEVGNVKIEGVGKALKIKGGEYCSHKAGQMAVVMSRPPQSFISALPIAFHDALPSLLSKLANRKVSLVKPHDFTYDEVEAWLDSASTVRKLLVSQWRAKANEPSFRKALIHNIKKHPEWDRVLFPEKYSNQKTKPVSEIP